MRIISGHFKGRRLVSFEAENIRPTTDRVKETLFNKLMGRIEGARVLDLFSGTGNLALECISRGAEHVDLVENHRKSLNIIRQNLDLLKVTDGYQLHAQDAFEFLKRYRGPAYDIILADPPFTQQWAHELAEVFSAHPAMGEGSILIIEASSKERMEAEYLPREDGGSGLIRLDQRAFGDKHLNFFQIRNVE